MPAGRNWFAGAAPRGGYQRSLPQGATRIMVAWTGVISDQSDGLNRFSCTLKIADGTGTNVFEHTTDRTYNQSPREFPGLGRNDWKQVVRVDVVAVDSSAGPGTIELSEAATNQGNSCFTAYVLYK